MVTPRNCHNLVFQQLTSQGMSFQLPENNWFEDFHLKTLSIKVHSPTNKSMEMLFFSQVGMCNNYMPSCIPITLSNEKWGLVICRYCGSRKQPLIWNCVKLEWCLLGLSFVCQQYEAMPNQSFVLFMEHLIIIHTVFS